MKAITKLYAWIARDAYGEEGVCSWWDEAEVKWIPLVHPDRIRAESYRSIALEICNDGQFPVRLAEFQLVETLESLP